MTPAAPFRPARDYRCGRCHYGAVLGDANVRCPMCGEESWVAAARRALDPELALERRLMAARTVGAATVAGGCFWYLEAAFQEIPGVLTTAVGYTGGSTSSPTYEDVVRGATGHLEAVRIDYDPRRVTYRELLARFWESHDATRLSKKRRYRSTIFTHSPEQARVARALKTKLEQETGQSLVTEIRPLARFSRAEDHHQRYLERRARAVLA